MNSDNQCIRGCYWKCCRWGMSRRTDRANGSSSPLWKNRCRVLFIIQGIASVVVLPLIIITLMIEVLGNNPCLDLVSIMFVVAFLCIYRGNLLVNSPSYFLLLHLPNSIRLRPILVSLDHFPVIGCYIFSWHPDLTHCYCKF